MQTIVASHIGTNPSRSVVCLLFIPWNFPSFQNTWCVLLKPCCRVLCVHDTKCSWLYVFISFCYARCLRFQSTHRLCQTCQITISFLPFLTFSKLLHPLLRSIIPFLGEDLVPGPLQTFAVSLWSQKSRLLFMEDHVSSSIFQFVVRLLLIINCNKKCIKTKEISLSIKVRGNFDATQIQGDGYVSLLKASKPTMIGSYISTTRYSVAAMLMPHMACSDCNYLMKPR